MTAKRDYDPSQAETEALIRGPAKGLVTWLLGGLGGLALTVASVAFGFAWSSNERLVRLEERDGAKAQALLDVKQELREIRDDLKVLSKAINDLSSRIPTR